VTLGIFDQQTRVERQAVRGGMLLGGRGIGDDEHQHQIRDQGRATGEDDQQHEDHTYPGDVDPRIRRIAVADSADHCTLTDLIEPAWRCSRIVRIRGRRATAHTAVRSWGRSWIGVDRPHLRDYLFDLASGHHALVGIEVGSALVGDRLFEVGDDLRAVWIG
jgi:hypothetical protein